VLDALATPVSGAEIFDIQSGNTSKSLNDGSFEILAGLTDSDKHIFLIEALGVSSEVTFASVQPGQAVVVFIVDFEEKTISVPQILMMDPHP